MQAAAANGYRCLGWAALAGMAVLTLATATTVAAREPSPRADWPQRLTLVEVPTVDASLNAVVAGQVDAAGAAMRRFDVLPWSMKKRLRVLAEALPQPDMLLGVRGDLGPGLKEALAKALLALGESPAGRAILARIGWKKLLRARDADDDVTRAFAHKPGLVY